MAEHPSSYGQFGGESEGSLNKAVRDAQNEVARLQVMGVSGLALINARKKLADAKTELGAATGSQQGILSASIATEATGFTGGFTPVAPPGPFLGGQGQTTSGPDVRASIASPTKPFGGGLTFLPPTPFLGGQGQTTTGPEVRAAFANSGGGGTSQEIARGEAALNSPFAPGASSSINFEGEGRLNSEVRNAQNEVSRVAGRPDSLSTRYADFRLRETQGNLQAATGSQRGVGRSRSGRRGVRPRPRVGRSSRRSSFRPRIHTSGRSFPG